MPNASASPPLTSSEDEPGLLDRYRRPPPRAGEHQSLGLAEHQPRRLDMLPPQVADLARPGAGKHEYPHRCDGDGHFLRRLLQHAGEAAILRW